MQPRNESTRYDVRMISDKTGNLYGFPHKKGSPPLWGAGAILKLSRCTADTLMPTSGEVFHPPTLAVETNHILWRGIHIGHYKGMHMKHLTVGLFDLADYPPRIISRPCSLLLFIAGWYLHYTKSEVPFPYFFLHLLGESYFFVFSVFPGVWHFTDTGVNNSGLVLDNTSERVVFTPFTRNIRLLLIYQ